MQQSTYVGVLLTVSAALLTSLVPGGFVETRDFSHINLVILITFNLYLTVLVIGSFLLAIAWFRQFECVKATLVAGVSYLVVYALDLLAIFPVSPTPMNHALWAIELAGLILALPLIGLSAYALTQTPKVQKNLPISVPCVWLICVGLLVVIYASMATMCGK